MKDLTPEYLKTILRYDPETGVLWWIPRPESTFPDIRSCNLWNTRYANSPANSVSSTGYVRVCINAKRYKGHRLIWLMEYGEWPIYEIDHIDGDPVNNRITNLRDVPHAHNQRNMQFRDVGGSGVTGVIWAKHAMKWVVKITKDGKTHHLGYFEDKNDAITARKAAEKRFGFHSNHGRTRIA